LNTRTGELNFPEYAFGGVRGVGCLYAFSQRALREIKGKAAFGGEAEKNFREGKCLVYKGLTAEGGFAGRAL